MNCDLIAVSTDTIDSHLEWLASPREDGGVSGLKFPLVADSDFKMCNDFGVLAEEDDEGYEG
jgi:alkyl hydroperoxide reductase subunit AhpC